MFAVQRSLPRTAEKKKALAAAAEAEPDSEEEEGEDEPAVTSDVERPDDSDAEEKEHEGGDDSDGEEAKGKPKGKAKSKSTSKSTSKKSKSKAKGKGKGGSGGISMPEDWPWEEAKQLFLKPDVTPAEELEVRFCVCLRIFVFDAYLVQWYLLMLLFVPFPSLCLCLVLSWVMQLLIFFHVSLFHKQLEWKNPDVDGLIQFLVTEKGFKYVFPGLSLVSTDCPAPFSSCRYPTSAPYFPLLLLFLIDLKSTAKTVSAKAPKNSKSSSTPSNRGG